MKAIGRNATQPYCAYDRQALIAADDLGFHASFVRRSQIGSGGGVAYNREEFEEIGERPRLITDK